MFRDGAERLLVFRLGAERFALRLADVDEVIDAPAVQPIPDAAANVIGIATLRGELVPLLDPAPLLQLKRAVHDDAGTVLLFVRGSRRLGLLVDDVYDAMMMEPDEVRSAPGTEATDGILVGVAHRGGELIGVLDTASLLDAATGSVAALER